MEFTYTKISRLGQLLEPRSGSNQKGQDPTRSESATLIAGSQSKERYSISIVCKCGAEPSLDAALHWLHYCAPQVKLKRKWIRNFVFRIFAKCLQNFAKFRTFEKFRRNFVIAKFSIKPHILYII
jgi:hypothetical protein